MTVRVLQAGWYRADFHTVGRLVRFRGLQLAARENYSPVHSGEPHKLGRPGATPGPAIEQAVIGRSLGRRKKTLQTKQLQPEPLARSRGPAAKTLPRSLIVNGL